MNNKIKKTLSMILLLVIVQGNLLPFNNLTPTSEVTDALLKSEFEPQVKALGADGIFNELERKEKVQKLITIQIKKYLGIISALPGRFKDKSGFNWSNIRGGCYDFSYIYWRILKNGFPVKRIRNRISITSESGFDVYTDHFFVIDDSLGEENEIIIDASYCQFFKTIPDELSPIFVGTRRDLIQLFLLYQNNIDWRNIAGPSRIKFAPKYWLTPEFFVKLQYNFDLNLENKERVIDTNPPIGFQELSKEIIMRSN